MPLALKIESATPKVALGGFSGFHLAEVNSYADTRELLIILPGYTGQSLTGLSVSLGLTAGSNSVTPTLTTLTSSATLQRFEWLLTAAQKLELLGNASRVEVRWQIGVTLSGQSAISGPEGSAYTGKFYLNKSASAPVQALSLESIVLREVTELNLQSIVLREVA